MSLIEWFVRWWTGLLVAVVCVLLACAALLGLIRWGAFEKVSVARLRRRPLVEVLVLAICVGGFVYHGSTKGFLGLQMMQSSPMTLSSLQTVSQEESPEGALFPSYTNAITNVCITGILPASTSVFLRASRPSGYSLPGGALDVYANGSLSTNGWSGIGRASVSAGDTDVVVELAHSALPDGYVRAMFFTLGLCIDTDGDGLTDSFETLVAHTDPALADSDGDGMPDGWEYAHGLNPLSDPDDNEAAGDNDRDGFTNGEEYRLGTSPGAEDTDGDGLDDVDEIGRVEELRGDDFLWLDTSSCTNLLGGNALYNYWHARVPFEAGFNANGVVYTNAQVDLEGYVTLINPTNESATVSVSQMRAGGGVSNFCWSATHLTIAAYNEDLCAKPRATDWSSRIVCGKVTEGDRDYQVIEYGRISHFDCRGETNVLMNCQVIFPANETNVIYISYQRVDDGIAELNRTPMFGVQMPATNCIPGRGRYANVSWAKYDGCFDSPLTLRYRLPTTTSPSQADEDGDGLLDPDELFVYHTNPFIADCDGDGLLDGDEARAGLNPNAVDTDRDGLPDGWEVSNGTNPLMGDDETDPDGDGLLNRWEYANGTDPLEGDPDNDGLEDLAESAWYDDEVTNIPWFSFTPLRTCAPSSNTGGALYSCDMPFTNRLAGSLVSVAVADVNGIVYFGVPTETNALRYSSTATSLAQSRNVACPMVAGYWSNLYMRPSSLGSNISFGIGTIGTNRYFVVQYDRVGTSGNASDEVSFQVSVPEGKPDVAYVRYGNMSDGRGLWNTVSIGCQGGKGDLATNWPCLSYIYADRPPTNASGKTIAFHFGCGGDPFVADTDGDGLDDLGEVSAGADPRREDTDGDGLPDAYEVAHGLDPASAIGRDGADGDPDGDGLANILEYEIGTDPGDADTDDDGLKDGQEVGILTISETGNWLDIDETEAVDITARFANKDMSMVNYGLEEPFSIQGELVTNVLIDVNGVVYFPRREWNGTLASRDGGSLNQCVCSNAFVVAPLWMDLYATTNAPATKISVWESGTGTNGCLVLQYENACPCANSDRSSVTNALSFQMSVSRDGLASVMVAYRDIVGTGIASSSPMVGVQSLGGLWVHKVSVGQPMLSSSGSNAWVLQYVMSLVNGSGFNFVPGYGTDPKKKDTDGDGMDDGDEATLGLAPMAPDSDGDGLWDGWEQTHGLDPKDPEGDNGADGDPDGDGVTNREEQDNQTDPGNADTDGDGVDDGTELGQGTSPTDQSDSLPVQWVTLTCDLPQDEQAHERQIVTIPAGRICYAAVFVYSEEYPTWTDQSSQYNDELSYNVAAEGHSSMSNLVRVNAEDAEWDDAIDHEANGFEPVILIDQKMYIASSSNLSVTVSMSAVNKGDDTHPSTIMVGFFPLNVVQANMPTACGVGGTTDSCVSYCRASIPSNGVAYITGEPSPPQLTAQIRGLPEWIGVDWGFSLTTERADHRFDGIDDRSLSEVTLHGGETFGIIEALNNEIVGGACSLTMKVGDLPSYTHRFYIRGKNPLDRTARDYITAHVDSEFRPYAWMIAKKETIHGNRVYNQFNAPDDQYKEKPNWGDPYGWGIGQIDKKRNGDTTAELYDWHENVASMNVVLRAKRNRYLEIVGLYRDAYQNDASTRWFEPDEVTTNVNGQVLTARQWTIITLYNGAQGTHPLPFAGHTNESTPIRFDPVTTNWVLYTNSKNYAPNVMRMRDETEVE